MTPLAALGLWARLRTPLALLAALAPVTAPDPAQAGENGVLVELYTSQGCNFCPPADQFLGELADRADVVGLSLNVSVWDYIGWKDRLAQPEFLERQRNYAYAHGERAIGTPHMIVHGMRAVPGGRRAAITEVVDGLADEPAEAAILLSRQDDTLTIALSGDAPGVVMIAPYRDVTQAIDAGENAGRTITYHNAALEVRRLATYAGDAESFTVTMSEEAEGVAAWLQQEVSEKPVGEVLAAAKLDF